MTTETLPKYSPQLAPQPKPMEGDAAEALPHAWPRRWPVEATVTAWIIIAAGAFFRIRAWAHWRSLWLDELYLAHSIVTRGMYHLLSEPLDKWQGAPPGFLILARLCVDLFGSGERSLRLPSLLFGLASLPLFFALVRRVLSTRGALIALILFSCLTSLIYYSGELKQYSADVCVALAILVSAVATAQKPQCRRTRLIYTVVCAVGLFFSHPAAMVVAASGVFLLIGRVMWARTDRVPVLSAVAPLLLTAIICTVLELLNIRLFLLPFLRGPMHDGLIKDWVQQGGFPPRQPNQAASWIWGSLLKIMQGYSTMYLRAADLGMFAAILGLGAMLINPRRRLRALLLFSPIVLAIIAAFLRRYPFADRLALFIVPVLVLLIAEGIDQIWGEQGWKRMCAALLISVMLIGGSVLHAGYLARWPVGREETEQIYAWIHRNWRSGDALLLSPLAGPSYDYYSPKTGMAGLSQLWQPTAGPGPGQSPADPLESSAQGIALEPWFIKAYDPQGKPELQADGYVVLQADRSDNPGLYLQDLDQIFDPPKAWNWPPMKRVWVVFAHDWDANNATLANLCLPELDRRALRIVQHTEEGASVYLYELKGTPSINMRD